MTIDNFIPTLWAKAILLNLNDQHVYASLFNRDYQGDIADHGDSVKISSFGRATIVDYTKNSTSLTFETLQDSTQFLVVDQAKAFAFEVDDIDARQQKPKLLKEFLQEALWGLGDTADDFAATTLEAGVQTANVLADVSVGTAAADDDAYEVLVDLGVKLTENNVPRAGRWAVVPPWYEGLLMKDPRFVSFGTPENIRNLRNGVSGQMKDINGFTIHVSNNVPVSGSEYRILAGHPVAATWAEQIMKTEAVRPEASFGDALKGLQLYGAKVTRPYALASVQATEA